MLDSPFKFLIYLGIAVALFKLLEGYLKRNSNSSTNDNASLRKASELQNRPPSRLGNILGENEKKFICAVLKRHRWSLVGAAKELGISPKGLELKIENYKITNDDVEESILTEPRKLLEMLQEVERTTIADALKKSRNDWKKASAYLGIEQSILSKKIKEYKLNFRA